jgi:glycosyltransferase involved in cell wall biosynthesis
MDTSNLATLSVVIPSLNRARFLVDTIDSVLRQDYPRIECIVVDGGSQDGTLEILRSYGDRIRWISEPDGGHADAINKGWKMSRGEVLAWLNADDVYVVPNGVSKAMSYLRKHADVDVVYGDCGVMEEDGRVTPEIYRPGPWDLAFAVKYCEHIIHQPSSFIRRPVLEKINWLDASFVQKKDHELWLRVGLAGFIRYVPEVFAYYRACPGISQRGDEAARSCPQLTKKFFSLPELPKEFRNERFRRRAWSNAHLMGAIWAFPQRNGGHRRLAWEFLCQAFLHDPSNLPYILARFGYLLGPRQLKLMARRLLMKMAPKLRTG